MKCKKCKDAGRGASSEDLLFFLFPRKPSLKRGCAAADHERTRPAAEGGGSQGENHRCRQCRKGRRDLALGLRAEAGTRTPVDPQPSEQAPGVTVVNEAIGAFSAASTIEIGARGGTAALGSSYRLGGLGEGGQCPAGPKRRRRGGCQRDPRGRRFGSGRPGARRRGVAVRPFHRWRRPRRHIGQIGKGAMPDRVCWTHGRFTTTRGNFSAIWARSVGGQTGRKRDISRLWRL